MKSAGTFATGAHVRRVIRSLDQQRRELEELEKTMGAPKRAIVAEAIVRNRETMATLVRAAA